MKKIFLLFSFLFINVCFSQENLLKITNAVSKEEATIKENKRIRIITTDGKKLSGRFRIFDKTSIILDNQIIKLDSIVKLKRHPLGLTIATNFYLIYPVLTTIPLGILLAIYLKEPIALSASIIGLVFIHKKWLYPNFLGSYKIKDNWKYEIQMNKTIVNPEVIPVANP